MPEKDTSLQEARAELRGFTNKKKVGEGAFGNVFLYKYEGNDPYIVSLCDQQKRIIVKFSNPPDVQEHKIARHIAAVREQRPDINLNRTNQIKVLEDANGEIGTLSQYECYNNFQQRPGETSADLQEFVHNSFFPAGSAVSTPPKVSNAFQADYGIFMSQLASNMYLAQDQLHQAGILHSDTATRNFLMTLDVDNKGNLIEMRPKIADYGLSSILPRGENFGDGYKQDGIVPLQWIDQNALFKNAAPTIQSDLFAQKATIIGMLGLSLVNKAQETNVLPKFNPNAADLSDRDRLNGYVQKIEEYANDPSCPASKREELAVFMECYKDYLTTVPEGSFEEAAQQDKAIFLKANEKFVVKMLDQIASKPNNQEALIALKRLQRIEIRNDKLRKGIEGRVNLLEQEVRRDSKNTENASASSATDQNDLDTQVQPKAAPNQNSSYAQVAAVPSNKIPGFTQVSDSSYAAVAAVPAKNKPGGYEVMAKPTGNSYGQVIPINKTPDLPAPNTAGYSRIDRKLNRTKAQRNLAADNPPKKLNRTKAQRNLAGIANANRNFKQQYTDSKQSFNKDQNPENKETTSPKKP